MEIFLKFLTLILPTYYRLVSVLDCIITRYNLFRDFFIYFQEQLLVHEDIKDVLHYEVPGPDNLCSQAWEPWNKMPLICVTYP